MAPRSIMCPEHPRWSEFLARLESIERCNNTTQYSRAILESMGQVEVEASLLELHERGCHCDCAILYHLSNGPPKALV